VRFDEIVLVQITVTAMLVLLFSLPLLAAAAVDR
jgi:hypothetical protein